VKLVWHQGDSKPPGWVPEWGGRSQVFIGEHGMLLGNGKLLPEEKFKDFQPPPETCALAGHWVEWVNYAKGAGPCRARISNTPGGRPRRTTSARGVPDREEDRVGLRETCAPGMRLSGPVHQAARVPQGLGRHPEGLMKAWIPKPSPGSGSHSPQTMRATFVVAP